MAKINGRELPRFDPNPSVRAGTEILRAAGVSFALAGRVAVWTHVPPNGQAFTKDVDFAVPYGYADVIEKAAREAGFETIRLSIGGVGAKKGDLAIDFIDRHPHAAQLFADAVAAAEDADVGEYNAPVVPKLFLLVMKLLPRQDKDDFDAMEIIKTLSADEYREARGLAEKYPGPLYVEHMDVLARRIGHAGVEPRYGLQDEAGDAEKPRQG